MLFFHALLFSLLCTFVIAVPVIDLTHDRESSEEAGPSSKKQRQDVADPNHKPDSHALHIPELVEKGIGKHKGTYYLYSMGKDDNDVIEIDADGKIFPYSLPSHAGDPLEPPRSSPEGVDKAREWLEGSWLLMPSALNEIRHRNDQLTFLSTKDKQLDFRVGGERDVAMQPTNSHLPLKAGDKDNQPPPEYDGKWYREPTASVFQGFADDVAEINHKSQPGRMVSIWKMGTRPGGIDWYPGRNGALNVKLVEMWRLVGRWRRVPYGSLETEKRHQVMVVTYGETGPGAQRKLRYQLITPGGEVVGA